MVGVQYIGFSIFTDSMEQFVKDDITKLLELEDSFLKYLWEHKNIPHFYYINASANITGIVLLQKPDFRNNNLIDYPLLQHGILL